MAQPERMDLSGQILSSLINARPEKGTDKQLNLLQIVSESLSAKHQMSVESKKTDKATLNDVQVQTVQE